MKKFSLDEDYSNKNESESSRLKIEGFELLVHFYAEKYQSDIRIPTQKNKNGDKTPCTGEDFLQNINDHLPSANNDNEENNKRIGFIILGENRAIPFVYIRENGREGLLCADALGYDSNYHGTNTLGMDFYAVAEKRETDKSSTFLDALTICKKATAKNSHNAFKIPNLLSKLNQESIKKDTYIAVKLPKELEENSSSNPQKHSEKNSTSKKQLKDFKDKFNKIMGSPNSLSKKDLKLSRIAEIQFYVEALSEEQIINDQKTRKEFIKGAKSFMKEALSQGKEINLYAYALIFTHNKKQQSKRMKKETASNDNDNIAHASESKNRENQSNLGFFKSQRTKLQENMSPPSNKRDIRESPILGQQEELEIFEHSDEYENPLYDDEPVKTSPVMQDQALEEAKQAPVEIFEHSDEYENPIYDDEPAKTTPVMQYQALEEAKQAPVEIFEHSDEYENPIYDDAPVKTTPVMQYQALEEAKQAPVEIFEHSDDYENPLYDDEPVKTTPVMQDQALEEAKQAPVEIFEHSDENEIYDEYDINAQDLVEIVNKEEFNNSAEEDDDNILSLR